MSTDSVNDTINTYKEMENFLQGITDKETLTGMLKNLKDEILGTSSEEGGIAGNYLPLTGGTLSNDSSVIYNGLTLYNKNTFFDVKFKTVLLNFRTADDCYSFIAFNKQEGLYFKYNKNILKIENTEEQDNTALTFNGIQVLTKEDKINALHDSDGNEYFNKSIYEELKPLTFTIKLDTTKYTTNNPYLNNDFDIKEQINNLLEIFNLYNKSKHIRFKIMGDNNETLFLGTFVSAIRLIGIAYGMDKDYNPITLKIEINSELNRLRIIKYSLPLFADNNTILTCLPNITK